MKQLKKILFIVNPIAGGKDKTDAVAMVHKACKDRDISLLTYITTGKNDVKEISNALKTNKPDRVIVVGGDGTIKTVATALKGTKIPLAILPAGSANGMVANLYFPLDQEQQLELLFGNNILAIDLLRLNNELCMHIADMGINAELVKKYEEGTVRGKLGYALKTIPALWDCNYPFTFEITSNGKTQFKEGVLLAFANAQSYGTGAYINPFGELNDGKFEIVIFKNFDIIEIIKTLNQSPNLDPEVVEVISTENATVRCAENVPFQIDGEYIGEIKEVNASIYKEKLLLVVPDNYNEMKDSIMG